MILSRDESKRLIAGGEIVGQTAQDRPRERRSRPLFPPLARPPIKAPAPAPTFPTRKLWKFAAGKSKLNCVGLPTKIKKPGLRHRGCR